MMNENLHRLLLYEEKEVHNIREGLNDRQEAIYLPACGCCHHVGEEEES